MVSDIPFPRRLSWLALLSVCAIVLAWAAPLLTDALHSFHAAWPLNSNQAVTDPHEAQAHLGEMLDEPLIFTSIGGTTLHRLMFSFWQAYLMFWAWSPLPLIHPPSALNSI